MHGRTIGPLSHLDTLGGGLYRLSLKRICEHFIPENEQRFFLIHFIWFLLPESLQIGTEKS